MRTKGLNKLLLGVPLITASYVWLALSTWAANPTITSLTYTPSAPLTVGQEVTFNIAGTDPDGDALEYRWDFGDGTPRTAYSTATTIRHTYTQSGNYTVFAQAKDPQGNIGAKTTTLTVIAPTTGMQPTRSSPIIVDAARRRVWVVHPDQNSVVIIDADTLTLRQEIATCKHPSNVALDGHSQIWITCRDSDQVLILDAATASLVQTLHLRYGAQPVGIVFSPDGTTGYIAEDSSGRIRRVNAATRTATGELWVGFTPSALAITGDGQRLLVTRQISTDGGGTVWSIALPAFNSVTNINLPIDSTSEDTALAARGLPNYVVGIAVTPDNGRAWIVAQKNNTLRGKFRDGQDLTFETTLRALVGTIDLSTNQEQVPARIDIDNHGQPSAISISPQGNHVFVTVQSNNRLVVFDRATRAQITGVDTGLAPQGVVIDPLTKRVFTQNFMSRTVSVFDAGAMLDTGAPALSLVKTISTVSKEQLSTQVLRGKQMFYNAADERMAMDGYISCASCHLDGGHDGRTWDFTDRGEGLRNTTTLLGRQGTGQGPVHWTGNFDEIQDFEHDIRGAFGGKGFMTDSAFRSGTRGQPLGDAKAGVSPDLDALAAYVNSLNKVGRSPYRNADGTLSADGQAGRKVFVDARCESCHAGPQFTDSAKRSRHDVGTRSAGSGARLGQPLDGFDTPTLRGLWNTAPYLHNGSAPSLTAVLQNQTHTGRQLSAEEIRLLVAYLLQIDDNELAAPSSLKSVFLPLVRR